MCGKVNTSADILSQRAQKWEWGSFDQALQHSYSMSEQTLGDMTWVNGWWSCGKGLEGRLYTVVTVTADTVFYKACVAGGRTQCATLVEQQWYVLQRWSKQQFWTSESPLWIFGAGWGAWVIAPTLEILAVKAAHVLGISVNQALVSRRENSIIGTHGLLLARQSSPWQAKLSPRGQVNSLCQTGAVKLFICQPLTPNGCFRYWLIRPISLWILRFIKCS